MLAMQDVTVHFGARAVLDRIHLYVDTGEHVVLQGPNGAGKTTLLRTAATLIHHEGRVEISGTCTTDDPVAARRHIAYVGHDGPCYPELTPTEQLRFQAGARGRPLSREQAHRALGEAGIHAGAERPSARLSRGQRQRLALVGALESGAPLLLLDEPATALDPEGQAWLEQRLKAHKAAWVAVTHDERLDGRRVHIAAGRIQEPAA